MNHPCLGCRAFTEKGRPERRVNCPQIGQQITMYGCQHILGAYSERARALIEAAKAGVAKGELAGNESR